MATTTTIKTTDVSTYVVENTLVIVHDLWAHVRYAQFALKRGVSYVPTMDDFVKITKTDGTTVIFAGQAKMPDTAQDPAMRDDLVYAVTARGWEALLDGVNITTGMSLAAGTPDTELVQSAIDTFWSVIASSGTVHKLYPGRMDLPFKRVPAGAWSLRDLLNWLVSQSGVSWWVDPTTKGLHYNDMEQAAPWVLSDAAGTGKKQYTSLVRQRDATARAVRVVVRDGGTNTTTVTDWDAWYEQNSRAANEPGAAADRFPQLPDIVDSTLDTDAKRTRRGWQALATQKAKTTLAIVLKDEGVEIGQLIDVISAKYGTGTAGDLILDQWEIHVTSTTEDLDTSMGRFLITKVTQRGLGRDLFSWEIEAGDPHEIMAALMARGAS